MEQRGRRYARVLGTRADVFAPFSIRLYRESNGPVADLLGTRN